MLFWKMFTSEQWLGTLTNRRELSAWNITDGKRSLFVSSLQNVSIKKRFHLVHPVCVLQSQTTRRFKDLLQLVTDESVFPLLHNEGDFVSAARQSETDFGWTAHSEGMTWIFWLWLWCPLLELSSSRCRFHLPDKYWLASAWSTTPTGWCQKTKEHQFIYFIFCWNPWLDHSDVICLASIKKECREDSWRSRRKQDFLIAASKPLVLMNHGNTQTL